MIFLNNLIKITNELVSKKTFLNLFEPLANGLIDYSLFRLLFYENLRSIGVK